MKKRTEEAIGWAVVFSGCGCLVALFIGLSIIIIGGALKILGIL